MKVALISCVSRKRSGSHQAEDLYSSPWFRKAKQHAKSRYDRWYILSARYHLLDPGEVVEEYDMTLLKAPVAYRREWAEIVAKQLGEVLRPGGEVYIFAGVRYRQFLVSMLEGVGLTVVVPLAGLSIGQQLKWLNEHP